MLLGYANILFLFKMLLIILEFTHGLGLQQLLLCDYNDDFPIPLILIYLLLGIFL